MARQLPGKAQILHLLAGGLAITHHLPAGFLNGPIVQRLHQHPTEHTAQLLMASPANGLGAELQEPQVGLAREMLLGLSIKTWRNHAFQKQAGELFCRGLVHGGVEGHDAAKGRNPIGIERPLEGVSRSGARSHATGIGVLDHHGGSLGAGAIAKLPHRGEGSLEVNQVVVAEFFALELVGRPPACCGVAMPSGLLMGILAVAQGLLGRHIQLQGSPRGGAIRQSSRQPGADSSVVARRVLKSRQGELTAQVGRHSPRSQGRQERLVLGRAGQHGHIGMVFGCRPHHGRTANVDVFDGGFKGHRRIGHRFPKGIEVHHHHINRINGLGRQIGLMGAIGALRQDAAVDARMQGFNPPAQDLRCTGVVGHLGHRQTSGLQRRCGSATGNQPIARCQQPLGQGNQPFFVGHTEKGRGRHGCSLVGWKANLSSSSVPVPSHDHAPRLQFGPLQRAPQWSSGSAAAPGVAARLGRRCP